MVKNSTGKNARKPRVTVVIPVYNTARYLGEAIESILSQTFGDFELIAIDDGSTDGSGRILKDYADRDDRMRVIKQENQGVSRSFNRGIELAAGGYLARMDSDDIALPTRLAQQVVYLDSHPDVVAVSGWVLRIDEEGAPIGYMKPPEKHEEIDDLLMGRSWPRKGGAFIHGCSMARTGVLRQLGGCREDFEPTDDRDLWLRISEVGRLHNIQRVCLKYRQNPTGLSGSRIQEQRAQSRRAVLDAYRRRGLTAPSELCYYEIPKYENEHRHFVATALGTAMTAAASGFYRSAWKYAWRAVRANPGNTRAYRVLLRVMLGPAAPPVARIARLLSGK
uniref:Glycosyl transferase family 2 n=1 Tax=Candidatus Kentrum sp. FM TaxID=2126340 RepID=A0A450SK79_9GAMM|nr:MAG: Glycosyl transferase family 2 [Candidatus Kentron sp. FM]VFJ56159.1 MAG: Glycosyl transferase family 2 [Candidatus Kentron sp. FM]VFK12944.1 MAG: Glycosyl transferase family 2 [Candidatus Kentron sp. FM]